MQARPVQPSFRGPTLQNESAEALGWWSTHTWRTMQSKLCRGLSLGAPLNLKPIVLTFRTQAWKTVRLSMHQFHSETLTNKVNWDLNLEIRGFTSDSKTDQQQNWGLWCPQWRWKILKLFWAVPRASLSQMWLSAGELDQGTSHSCALAL